MKKRNIRIHRLGFIKGGVCDKIHQARLKREQGALHAVDMLFEQEKRCLKKVSQYRFVVLNYPKWSWREYHRLWGGDREIGVHRYMDDVIPQLIETKIEVTRNFLKKLARQIASFEFGVSTSEPNNPLAILEGRVKFGYAPPHADHIYQERFGKK